MSSLAFIHSRSPLAALLGLGILYAITWVVLCVNAARRRSTLARAYCCKPIACYPHREPPFGLDVCLESAWLLRSGQLMPRVAARYRDMGKYTFGMLALGDAVTYTAEPENIRAMLDTQFEDFEGPVRKSGHAIPAVDGDQTGWSRALLSRAFTRRQVRDLEMFDRHVGRFVARIPRHGQTVDLQELFSMLTMDSATEFLLGQSSALLADEVARERGRRFHDAFSCIAECAALEVRLGKLATLMMPSRKLRTAKAFVYEYIGEHVRRAVEARKSGLDAEKEKGEQGRAGPYVFLDELAQTSLGEQEIQDELLSTLSAVRDNTASLLGSTFHVLARRKDVWAKLQREVASLGNETPTFERLQSMKYLQYTLHEVLRLHPIVPSNGRVAVRDTTLPVGGGSDQRAPIFVRKGMHVAYHVYVMHRRKDLYGDDAEDFKPERWETLRTGWQYLPFNGGPRMCPGQQFALTEAALTIVRLLQAFKGVEPRNEVPLAAEVALISATRGGLKLAMIPA